MEIQKNQLIHDLFKVLFCDFRLKGRTVLIGFVTIQKTWRIIRTEGNIQDVDVHKWEELERSFIHGFLINHSPKSESSKGKERSGCTRQLAAITCAVSAGIFPKEAKNLKYRMLRNFRAKKALLLFESPTNTHSNMWFCSLTCNKDNFVLQEVQKGTTALFKALEKEPSLFSWAKQD